MGRNVRGGKDTVVHLHGNSVVIAMVEQRRHTVEQLKMEFPSKFHFIRNHNLHWLPQGLRGALCYVKGVVGVVVKGVGVAAIIQQLLPNAFHDKEFFVVNLREEGFYLQQVGGHPISPRSPGAIKPPLPLTDSNGNIKLSIEGPDILMSLSLSKVVPSRLLQQVESDSLAVRRETRNRFRENRSVTRNLENVDFRKSEYGFLKINVRFLKINVRFLKFLKA